MVKWKNFNEVLDKSDNHGQHLFLSQIYLAKAKVGLFAAPEEVRVSAIPPAILTIIFFIIIKKCGLVEGALRVTLSCSM